MKSESARSAMKRNLGIGAAAIGIAGAGYLAAYVKSVLDGLSIPRAPYAWRPERGRSVFLKGANLIDVKRGQVQRERGVIFRDGQITEVVATRDLDKVNANRTFDCEGLFLMPGLINCHVHTLMPGTALLPPDVLLSVKRQAVRNLEECATHGVTTIRDTNSLSLVLNNLGQQIEMLELLGPRVVSCGPALLARGGYPDFSRQLPPTLARKYGDLAIYVRNPESARQAVRTAVDQGARFIKIFFDDRSLFFGRKPLNKLDDKSVRAIVDEAHRLGRRVAVHQTQLSGFRRALRLGVDDLEHVPIDKFLTDKDVTDYMDGGHHITPTISVAVALGIAPEGHPSRAEPLVEAMQAERERMLRVICPAVAEEAVFKANIKMVKLYMDGSVPRKFGASSLSDNEVYLEAFTKKNPNIQMLYEAGATFCCGNDGGTPLSFPGTLSVEMEALEWFGLSRADILRAATINAAGLLDMESELGSVEPGKLADILILSADPLKDIRSVERVEGVFRSGVLLHRGRRLPLESAGQPGS